MKRAMIILLLISAMISGCGKTGNVVNEPKNLTLEEAAEIAMNRVYELTDNKDIIDQNGMKVNNATYEGDMDRWNIVLLVSHTNIKTYVYNNGTVKVLPYRIEYN
jgi:beta-N-acetylglucosaminidase